MKKTAIFLNFYNRVNGKTGSHSQKNKYCPPSSAERACNSQWYLEFKPDLCYNKTNTKRKGDCYEEKDTRTLPNYFP